MRLSISTTALLLSYVSLSAQSSHQLSAEGGDIVFTPIIHASVQVEHAGTVIHVDPWSAGDLSQAKPADLILVTDDPGHHLDLQAIEQLRKPGAPVVLTATAQARFADGRVLSNGQTGVFAGITVEAIPAYDLTPGRPLHPMGEANGYVITLGGRRIFFAGVGECVPAIQALRDIDVAFIPMNLPVDRMRPIPAAECVKTFKPKIVYLNHYDQGYTRWLTNPRGPRPGGAQDTAATIQAFRDAIQDEPIEFRDIGWYPPVQ
ncbi:MAG: MBL fold metallo-hydrolase [Acidobacteriota bacterium]|nr:MBL fold metallo-hydrolase [Acidobacteriota bacterium]